MTRTGEEEDELNKMGGFYIGWCLLSLSQGVRAQG